MGTLGPAIRTDAGPPVLVLTADVTQTTRHRALSAGARDFISKPFDHEEVLLRVLICVIVAELGDEREAIEHLQPACLELTRPLSHRVLEPLVVLRQLALAATDREQIPYA